MKFIVMYHYVNDKMGITPNKLDEQLHLLKKHCRILPLDALLSCDSNEPACALTFDDGLKDAITGALPVLRTHQTTAAFFIPGSILHSRTALMDVQRRHLLMHTIGTEQLIRELNERLPYYYAIKPTLAMQADYLDDLPVASMKWTLDHLDADIVSPVLQSLIAKYCGDEKLLFEEFYLSLNDICHLLDNGMIIGGHGYTHQQLNTLSYRDQLCELMACAHAIKAVIGTRELMLSYPSGGYTPLTVRLVKHAGYSKAFTTVKISVEQSSEPLEIGRFDCIDLQNIGKILCN
jgi:peptidoglycan/xylan/chitin deacetylase (PgdA/CDA1 family)